MAKVYKVSYKYEIESQKYKEEERYNWGKSYNLKKFRFQ